MILRNTAMQVIYSLDYPVAGPGSFPQFMTSMEASKHLKVLLADREETKSGIRKTYHCIPRAMS